VDVILSNGKFLLQANIKWFKDEKNTT